MIIQKFVVAVLFTFGMCASNSVPLNRATRIISNADIPCALIELGNPTFLVDSTFPVEMEISLSINATEEFVEIYGPSAYRDPRNKGHVQCVQDFFDGLGHITSNALEQLTDAIELRTMTKDEKRSPVLPLALAVASLVASGKNSELTNIKAFWNMFGLL